MANNPNTDFIVEELEIKETDELGPDDFSFVIGPDGDLVSMTIPEHLMTDLPDEVSLILQMYGIDDINLLDNRTLH